jgi:kynurenine formamidase
MAEAFAEIRDQCRNWGRWGIEDELGTLNLVTEEARRRAAAEVRTGTAISASRVLRPENDVFGRTERQMVRLPSDPPVALGAPNFVIDKWSVSHHGESHTHMDSTAHVVFEGKTYNGRDASDVVNNTEGATHGDIAAIAASGIFARGVLLDMPTVLADDPAFDPERHLERGHAISPQELSRAVTVAGVKFEEGDVLLLRTGFPTALDQCAREEHGGDRERVDRNKLGCAGLHPSAMPLLKQWGVSLLGTDTHGEANPPGMPEFPFSTHILALVDMGLPILDNATFEELARVCSERQRYTFAVSLNPLPYEGGTGSPVNPIVLM